MRLQSFYPIVVTEHLTACRDFYSHWFGLELQRGADLHDLHDRLARMVGCFDASARYPADRLVLTYPVPC